MIFLEDTGQYHDVRVAVDDKAVSTTELSKGVYVFCPKGKHVVTVSADAF